MQDLTKFSDENLFRACIDGNEASFEELYNRYWYKLYAEAFKRLRKAEIAEEIIQDLFTSIWLNRQKITIHSSISGYLFTSVRYLVLSYLQKELVRNNYKSYVKGSFKDVDNSTEMIISFNELQEQIESHVRLLPEKCRYIYELSRKEFKTNKEIADLLGISEKTVENQLTKALGRLKIAVKALIIYVFLLFY
ncbi:RNA polymerase sigma-70 factor [Olivibacter domesticus]|uniref:RNA polymerase sigma-70 factor, ECF subfamily n=1 Tax=Olivibacter domesticus TaxID=407022 RepID=A0A1H7Q8W5_OLID1|nr:RNA polymerase sigma-70 factor [Olivibacter domesticus]SEL44114.1 RNA polymerase sigma-70 factor, ECF subfamily [Olivibacter domesticus]